jgi:hypothetical protein
MQPTSFINRQGGLHIGGREMKSSESIFSIIGILLLGMVVASATSSEMSGGMSVAADNGGYISGVSEPGSYSVMLGDSAFTRDINAGEEQEFDALFANDDNTFGAAKATWSLSSRITKKDPSKCYALLTFKAPDKLMDIELLQSTRPDSISHDEFIASVKTAGSTWNLAVKSRDFFGTVSDDTDGTPPQANDGHFVQSFGSYPGSSWLAGSWLTWNTKSKKLIDCDVIYNKAYELNNKAYEYSANQELTKDASLYLVDLQAVALHEMGHAVGLDDIYNKPDKSWDTSEVMNYYILGQPRYDLGAGDKAGLKAKYGK